MQVIGGDEGLQAEFAVLAIDQQTMKGKLHEC
jgi:hypothetical protein